MIPDASGGGGVFPREDGVCFQPFLLAFVLVRPELRAAVVKEKKEKKEKKKKEKKLLAFVLVRPELRAAVVKGRKV